MNTNLPEPATDRHPVLRRGTTERRDHLTPAHAAAASRLRRWIGAAMQALTPTPIPTEPEAPADRPPHGPDGAPIDSRVLPPWRPFSPRF